MLVSWYRQTRAPSTYTLVLEISADIRVRPIFTAQRVSRPSLSPDSLSSPSFRTVKMRTRVCHLLAHREYRRDQSVRPLCSPPINKKKKKNIREISLIISKKRLRIILALLHAEYAPRDASYSGSVTVAERLFLRRISLLCLRAGGEGSAERNDKSISYIGACAIECTQTPLSENNRRTLGTNNRHLFVTLSPSRDEKLNA